MPWWLPVNPMNRAEELRHYITDAKAYVAITTGDLADEVASASNGIDGDRLRHLIVTQFDDVLEGTDKSAIPSPWRNWLNERHPLPSLLQGDVHDWQDVMRSTSCPPCSLAAMIWLCCLTPVVR